MHVLVNICLYIHRCISGIYACISKIYVYIYIDVFQVYMHVLVNIYVYIYIDVFQVYMHVLVNFVTKKCIVILLSILRAKWNFYYGFKY